ncbi:hypothetical protein NKOR_06230 [Candidatus Nitrosopumilus koreensis AR1]|uniref:Fibronectin type III domain-containing protein n=1 Tax=Candidatus Nitrosopumilus koreensis AR1 TaxID=1229908 RepID=K0B7I1_9ARCH|nr:MULTISPECIES: hypothetical protein [Nitrosopumilus]AFS81127.1 hypothetical protein NKOR_06230 [Candidatus Nitrosopumilus koreensis AR1]
MKPLLIAMSVAVLGLFGTAYAQPLDDIDTAVIEYDGSLASVQVTWNNDDAVSYYEVGCVSCVPNFSQNTSDNEIVLADITSLENGLAVLYVIAYHDDSDMVTVKQVMLNLH